MPSILSPYAEEIAMSIIQAQEQGKWTDERDKYERHRLSDDLAVQEICEDEYWRLLHLFSQ